MHRITPVVCAALIGVTGSIGLAAPRQDSDRPFGVICQPPECDLKRSIPVSVEGPLDSAPQLIDLVRSTPVSAFAGDVRGGTIDQWLAAVLAAYTDPVRPDFLSWSLTFCEDRQSAVPRAGPDLCVDATAVLAEEKIVTVRIAIADGTSTLDGRTGWKLRPPAIDDIYIERLANSLPVDSLHVARLGEIVTSLERAPDKWPAVDLKSSVRWAPARWNPEDVVQFTITIENAGDRDADRAHVNVLIGAAHEGTSDEIRRDWFPRVPAHGKRELVVSARLPRGTGIVHVSVEPAPGPKRFREANPADNETTIAVEPAK